MNEWQKRACLALRPRRDLNRATPIHFTAELEQELTAPLRLSVPPLVVPNGIELDEFRELPAAGFLRNTFPQIGDRSILLFLSRVHHVAGLDILIPALDRLQQSDAVLVVAGPEDDECVHRLRRLAAALHDADRVFFAGPLYGPPTHFRPSSMRPCLCFQAVRKPSAS